MHIQSKYVKYKRFNEYIWAEFCYTDKSEKLSLQKNYVEDIFVLSNILGRLEVYLLDKKDLENGRIDANASIGQTLFQQAKDGNTAAAIFWLKTRAQWKETQVNELVNPDGSPILSGIQVMFVKPQDA